MMLNKCNITNNNNNGSIHAQKHTVMKTILETGEQITIRVLTLNCWGLWLGAKKRLQRMGAIVKYLQKHEYDVVFLQEVWVTSDFEVIKEGTRNIYRFAHLFRSGSVLGSSGIVILCKWLPKVIHFEPYSLNGSPFYPWHGDWFAGKGIAYSRVDLDNLTMHLLTTHTHAYYKENEPIHDQYSVHRVCQSFQLARFITFIREACARNHNGQDLLIVAGDMNSTSSELPYKILTTMAGLVDCFKASRYSDPNSNHVIECDTEDEDITYCHPRNSFTPTRKPSMKRIDFILCSMLNDGHCVVDRIDSKDTTSLEFSLSDHEPVMIELKLCPDKSYIDHSRPSVVDTKVSHTNNIQVMEETKHLLVQYYKYNRRSKTRLFYLVMFMFMVTLPITTYYAVLNDLIPISTIVFVWLAASFLFAIGLMIGYLSYRFEQGAIKAILNDIACKIAVAQDHHEGKLYEQSN